MYYKVFKAEDLFLAMLAFLLSVVVCFAQDKVKVDSLVNAVIEAKDPKTTMNAKTELAWHYLNNDDQLAEKFAYEGYELAISYGDSAKIVRSGRIRGQALRRLDRISEAILVFQYILPIARRNGMLDEYKKILNSLALAYTFTAEYDKALQCHFESLVMREEEGDKAEISISLNNIGLVYFKLHNYEGALKYFTQCLQIQEELNYTSTIPTAYINVGLSYLHLDYYEKAIEYMTMGVDRCGENCTIDMLMEGNFGLGEAYFRSNDLSQAEKYLNESLRIATVNKNRRWRAENLIYLGAVFESREQYEQAIKCWNEADSVAQSIHYNQLLMDTYKRLSGIYNKMNDFEKAARYQGKYIELTDALVTQDLVKKISKIQSDYEERENIATIASKEELIKQQRDLNVAVAVIAMLAGLLVLVLQFGNRNIKRVNAKLSEAKEIIQKQNVELEYKNRELDIEVDKKTIDLARVNQSLKQVNDELDNFIYKTSHDIRGPLASLKGMCNVALMDVKDPIALEYLRKLDATAERLNSILTRLVIINQINNSKMNVERIDFNQVVNDVMMLEKKKGLPPDLRIGISIDPLTEIQSDKELVRIVLENLIDNAIKFYNDSERVESFMNVHISKYDENSVKVRVVDNGIGISESSPGKLFQMFSRASERSETGGIGLYITKTATEKVGGRVGLLTTPEGYTEFYVIFPVAPYAESSKLERRLI